MIHIHSRISLLMLALLGSQLLLAQQADQPSEKYLKYKDNPNYRDGYIITWGNQRIDGLLKDAAFGASSGSGSAIFVSKDGKKTTYRPMDIKGYGFISTEFISDSKLFYEVVLKGPKVSMYKVVDSQWSPGVSTGFGAPSAGGYSREVEKMFLMKTNDIELFAVKRLEFANDLAVYFSDCPALSKLIAERELKFKDLNEIVSRYNTCP